jgi:ribosomal protein L32
MLAGGFVAKLLITVLVIVVVWRGYRVWTDMRRRLEQAKAEERRRRRTPAPVDLVPCPSCGTYIAPGTPCPTPSCARARAS